MTNKIENMKRFDFARAGDAARRRLQRHELVLHGVGGGHRVDAEAGRERFEAAPDRICGIELTANGQKIGWSIAEYLTSLDRKVVALLEAEPSAK